VINGFFDEFEYDATGVRAGELVIDSNLVTFENLEPLDFTGNVINNLTINIDPTDAIAEQIATTVEPLAPGQTRTSFTGGLELIDFSNPIISFTINGDPNDNDVFDMEGFGSGYDADFTIGGSISDTVNFQVNPSDLGTGNLTVTTEDVNVNAGVTTIGGSVSCTVMGNMSFGAAGVLNSGGGTVTITGQSITGDSTFSMATGSQINAGAGDINLTFDLFDLSAGASIAGTGNLAIAPIVAATTIGLGGGTGELNLSDTELASLQDGFSTITIGQSDAGNIALDTVTFLDSITLLTGGHTIDAAGTDIDAGINIVNIDGTVAPGTSPGTLSVVGNVALSDNSIYSVELTGTPTGGSHDQLVATGTVSIGNNITLNLDTTLYTEGPGSITIISRTGGSGTFVGLAEGAQTNPGSTPNFTISYIGGDGDDVVLIAASPTVIRLSGFSAYNHVDIYIWFLSLVVVGSLIGVTFARRLRRR
jgi:hypothetical protein